MSVTASRYLVLGGAGFLGSYVVQGLVDRGEPHVAVYDLNEPPEEDRIEGVAYFAGDICDYDALLAVLKKTSSSVVFHTVAPIHGSSDATQYRVNVDGTQAVLDACRDPALHGSVSKLVYTSSVGVTWTAQKINGLSEDQLSYPETGYDMYHHTKAIAEKTVLAADGHGLRTTVIRPCGMLGPRDPQMLHRLATVLKNGQHKLQLGDNKNLIDWVYAGNVADAQILAADKLPSLSSAEETGYSTNDPVAGQVFIITNGSPFTIYDFNRMVWRALGAPAADFEAKNIVTIPRWLALCLAFVAESWCKLTGSKTEFTRFAVTFATSTQWYNIEKARQRLGYQPRVSLEEAAALSAKWWVEKGAEEHAKKTDAHS